MPYVKNSASYKTRSKRSRGRKRAAALAILCLLAVVLALALRPRSHAAGVAAFHPEAASAAVVHRTQAAPWTAASREELGREIRSALAGGTNGAREWSCVVIAQDGTVLYDDRASHAVTPASAQKLIVADASLTARGTGYRFDTLFAASQPPSGDTLQGDLYVAGSGDPSLRSDDLKAGVAALRAQGITTIGGRVVIDPSALAGEEINPLWNADDANEDFMTATSGISLDGDTAEFHVIGAGAGAPAQVSVYPKSSALHVYGSVASGGGDDVIIAATETPNEFRLAGNIPPGVEEKYWLPVHGIPQYAASVMDAMLHGDGIVTDHPATTGAAPVDASILWTHRSKPLADLVKHMLIFSDNHYAEQLMRGLGGMNGGIATDATGLAEERHILQTQGIPTPGLHIVDGSGLAHANRVSALTLGSILAHFDAAQGGNSLYPLLPRGGKDGTLRMYHFTSAAGRVRAKSGHLDDAASLAGYVNTRRHGRVVFAFLINGSPGDPDDAIVAAVDRIAAR